MITQIHPIIPKNMLEDLDAKIKCIHQEFCESLLEHNRCDASEFEASNFILDRLKLNAFFEVIHNKNEKGIFYSNTFLLESWAKYMDIHTKTNPVPNNYKEVKKYFESYIKDSSDYFLKNAICLN